MASLLDIGKSLVGKVNPILQQLSNADLNPLAQGTQSFRTWQQKPSNQLVQRAIQPIQQRPSNLYPQRSNPITNLINVGRMQTQAKARQFVNQTAANRSAIKFQQMQEPTLQGKLAVNMEQISGFPKRLFQGVKPSQFNPQERQQLAMGATNVGGISGGIGISRKNFGMSKAQLSYFKSLPKGARDIIGRFAEMVEKDPSGMNRKVLGEYKSPSGWVNVGDYVQAVVDEAFGGSASTLTNRQMKNLLDVALETADNYKGNVKLFSGLSTQSVREGQPLKPQSTVGVKSAVPTGQISPLPAEVTTKIPVQPGALPETPGVLGGGQANIPKGVSSAPVIDPVQKIINAIKEAKPIRGQQEKLYSIERGKRVARVAGVGKNIPGEKGFYAQLGQLKGELPKVQYESLRGKIQQPDIDALFNQIQTFPMSEFEKISAKGGLAKILGAQGGTVPNQSELKLLSEVFPPEFVQAILSQRTAWQKLTGLGAEALNLPRAIMATADLSAPLRQGVFLIGKPKTWLPAFGSMFKYFASEKSYKGLGDQIKSRPTYKLMRENKLALTDMSPILQSREEAFMSSLAEKIPGFGVLAKASNRAYSGFLNKLRADTFDDLVRTAKQQGLDKENPKVIADIAKFVNSATGRGDLGSLNRASVVLNGAFFSPRLMASRLNMLNPTYYMSLEPMVRKEALKSLFTFAGTGATILGLAKLGGADVGADPRSADFGKIKVGDTRYDIWGGFQQYIVLASRLLSGQMVSSTTGKEFNLGEGYKSTTRLDILQRFLESKTAPVASFALALLKGQNTMGVKTNIPVEIADRFIPMFVQDMYDLVKERGNQGALMAIPGMFGVGSQTYTDQIPMNAKTPAGKPKVAWRQAPSLGETLINKITGTQISDIPEEEWGPLYAEKQQKALDDIEIQKIKATVLETGEQQTFKDKLIYMDDGILKTKTIKDKEASGGSKTTTKKKTKAVKKIAIKKIATTKIKIAKAKKFSMKKLPKPKKFKTKSGYKILVYKDTTPTVKITKPTVKWS